MAKFNGAKVAELRGRRTQSELAHALFNRGFGTTQTQVSRWENGQTPRRYILPALAHELGCAPEELFDDDEEDDLLSQLMSEIEVVMRKRLVRS